MFLQLFVAATLYALGASIFGHFERYTPLGRRIAKLFTFLGITALITYYGGPLLGWLWIVGMFAIGISFHVWWTRKHGIGVFSGEPRAKYYQLRGWSQYL